MQKMKKSELKEIIREELLREMSFLEKAKSALIALFKSENGKITVDKLKNKFKEGGWIRTYGETNLKYALNNLSQHIITKGLNIGKDEKMVFDNTPPIKNYFPE